jgi:hypothetical protein
MHSPVGTHESDPAVALFPQKQVAGFVGNGVPENAPCKELFALGSRSRLAVEDRRVFTESLSGEKSHAKNVSYAGSISSDNDPYDQFRELPSLKAPMVGRLNLTIEPDSFDAGPTEDPSDLVLSLKPSFSRNAGTVVNA